MFYVLLVHCNSSDWPVVLAGSVWVQGIFSLANDTIYKMMLFQFFSDLNVFHFSRLQQLSRISEIPEHRRERADAIVCLVQPSGRTSVYWVRVMLGTSL